MYLNQIFLNPQLNKKNNFGYASPVFRGAKSLPVVQKTLSKDIVQFLAENKTKPGEKGCLSTCAKWILGLAGTVATIFDGTVFYKYLKRPSIKEVAKNFSEIFRRDVSTEEAKKLVSEYKDLLKIEDSEIFYKKIYEKVKNDYGYADIDIPIIFSNANMDSCPAAWCKSKGEIHVFRKLTNKLDEQAKKDLIKEPLHEFHHVKQEEIAYRTSVEKLLDAMEENYSKVVIGHILGFSEGKQKWFAEKILNMSLDDMLKTLRNEAGKEKPDVEFILNKTKWSFKRDNIKESLDRIFGRMPKYTEGSKEYELGLKYIEGERNYVTSEIDKTKYREQLSEVEAYATKDKWLTICKYIETHDK